MLVCSLVEAVLLENVFQEARKELSKRTILVEHWLETDPQGDFYLHIILQKQRERITMSDQQRNLDKKLTSP